MLNFGRGFLLFFLVLISCILANTCRALSLKDEKNREFTDGHPVLTAFIDENNGANSVAPGQQQDNYLANPPLDDGVNGGSGPSTQSTGNGSDDTLVCGVICVNSCCCGVYIGLSIIMAVLNVLLSVYAFYAASKLFSNAVESWNFYASGGFWLIGAAFTGLLTGGLIAGFISGCATTILLLSTSCMSFLISLLLIGVRGAALGALGSAGCAAAISSMLSLKVTGFFVSIFIGLLVGLILGFAPFAQSLRMNQRYIRRSLPRDRVAKKSAKTYHSFAETGGAGTEDEKKSLII